MTDKQIEPSDEREIGYFQIDNEILEDYTLSPLALTVYCHLVKWSAAKTRTGYASVTSICERYSKGRATVVAAFKELLTANLIQHRATSDRGVKRYGILKVPKSGVLPQNTYSGAEQEVFYDRTGPVPGQNTRKKEQRKIKETSKIPASAALPKDSESSLSPRHLSDTETEVPTAPKKVARGGAPHPDHHRLMSVFHTLHLEAFGEKPALGPRDGAALKAMLAAHGPEAVEQKARALARVSKEAKGGFWKCAILPSVLQSRWNSPELIKSPSKQVVNYAEHRAKHLENQRKLGIMV